MVMNPLESLQIGMVEAFVHRQKLVFDAMLELFPGLPIMLKFTHFASEEDLKEVVNKTVTTPSSGFWGTEKQWKYGSHGVGCLLVHANSGEPIEWDAPDIDVFDRYWFGNWLRWYAKTNNLTDLIETDNDAIHEMLLEFERQGLLGRGNPPEPAKFRLIVKTSDEPE